MKKIILIILLIFSINSESFATDACDTFIPQESSFIWEATMSARFRDYPCTYKSNILWTSTIWINYTIIQKVDGWYKIESELWNNVWIWDQAIKEIEDIIIQEENSKKEIIENTYSLSISDKVLVNKLFNSLNKIIQEKWEVFQEKLIKRIDTIISENQLTERIKNILQELNIKIENIIFIDDKIENKEINLNYTENYLSEYNIDLDKVKETWLWWYNMEREVLWKYKYIYNSQLEQTAIDWSNISKDRWEITHKRNSTDSYYDYNKITSWFKNRWVSCKNIDKVTHTENIWWWTYSCNDSDCTDEFINWIKNTFEYYMAEKDQDYKAHYQSIMNNYFKEIWIWFAVKKKSNNYYQYYLTVHYCTELEN